METLVTEGQPLLDRGLEEAKKFSKEEVLQWTAAALNDRETETIKQAVDVMREGGVKGQDLVTLTYDMLKQGGIPMGTASNLARRIQSLQAKKAARRSRKLVSFFERKACQNIFLFVFVPCMQWIFQALKS